MSAQFNDTTNYKGLVQLYEKEIGANRGDVSGDTNRLKEFTADVNIALDDFWNIAIPASGTWQIDDSNHTDYPIITTNIVANQRDYPFTTDEGGNLILDVYRVFVLTSATATGYVEIFPVDAQSDLYTEGLTDGQNSTGAPCTYDKTANSIFLDPVPSYNATNGLKLYINREASYFTYTDTTKKPGVPGILQKYLYLKPAAEYARRNNLTNADRLAVEVAKMEGIQGRPGMIEEYFSYRARDERKQLTMARINHR